MAPTAACEVEVPDVISDPEADVAGGDGSHPRPARGEKVPPNVPPCPHDPDPALEPVVVPAAPVAAAADDSTDGKHPLTARKVPPNKKKEVIIYQKGKAN